MPPKRKRATLSSIMPSPSTPTNAQLAIQRDELLSSGTVTMMDSSPLPPKKLRDQESVQADTGDVLPPTPDALGGGTTETQGVAASPAKKKLGRPRKVVTADAEVSAEPVVKKKRAAPKKGKKAAKTPEVVVDDSEGEASHATKPVTEKKQQPQQQQQQPLVPLTPLPTALKHKVKAVHAFLDIHDSPLLARGSSDNNIVIVDGLDLLAALIILNVDYQLGPATTDISFEDTSEIVVSWLGAGKVSVDFDLTCDMERAAQSKLADSGEDLENLNLVEVEIEMLLAHRRRLAVDDDPAAGFRVYDRAQDEGISASL